MDVMSWRRGAEDFMREVRSVQLTCRIARLLSLGYAMEARVLALTAALMSVGCPAEIGEECDEDASSIAHASALCEDGSICVDGICVESRKEGEQCGKTNILYACEGNNIHCRFSSKRSAFFCIKSKEIGESCDILDGNPKGCLGFPECTEDELWPDNVPTPNFRGVCDPAVHCINGLCQKSKNEGSKCYIGDENSCLEIFNCIPSDISVSIPLSETTLNTIDRTNGVCSPLAKRDEPCDPANHIKCAAGLMCNTDNVCEELR